MLVVAVVVVVGGGHVVVAVVIACYCCCGCVGSLSLSFQSLSIFTCFSFFLSRRRRRSGGEGEEEEKEVLVNLERVEPSVPQGPEVALCQVSEHALFLLSSLPSSLPSSFPLPSRFPSSPGLVELEDVVLQPQNQVSKSPGMVKAAPGKAMAIPIRSDVGK